MVNKACFLDRDGTINLLVDRGTKQVAPWYYAEFDYIDGVIEAVDLIKNLGYTTHVVTNQPDIMDGFMNIETLDAIHQSLKRDLKVDTISYALHRNAYDYKPNNGMLEKIINENNISRKHSWMIGDSWKDIVAGYRSGLKTIYIGENWKGNEDYPDVRPNFVARNLLVAAGIIQTLGG